MRKAPHSTKIKEGDTFEGDDMVVKKTFDASHMLNDAQHAREPTDNSFGSDYNHVRNVNLRLLNGRTTTADGH